MLICFLLLCYSHTHGSKYLRDDLIFFVVVTSFWCCFPGWEDVCHLCFEMNSGKYSRFLKRSLLSSEHDFAINIQVGRKLWRLLVQTTHGLSLLPIMARCCFWILLHRAHDLPHGRTWQRVPKKDNCIIRLFNSPTYFSCYQQLVTSASWYASVSCKHSL